jgi:predicted RNA-binding Zn-ribbon protein involved in translation (DUF1610 family)
MSDLMNGPENDTFGFVCPICGGRVHMVRATRSENPGEDREQYMDPALQHKFRGNCQCATWIYWFDLGKKETIEAQKRARRGEGPHLYSFKCQTCGHSIGGSSVLKVCSWQRTLTFSNHVMIEPAYF